MTEEQQLEFLLAMCCAVGTTSTINDFHPTKKADEQSLEDREVLDEFMESACGGGWAWEFAANAAEEAEVIRQVAQYIQSGRRA